MCHSTFFKLLAIILACISHNLFASSKKLSDEDVQAVEKAAIDSEEEQKQRQAIAVMLAEEKDYHHDGALPKAPPECYHVKDTFVHPATVRRFRSNLAGLDFC